MTSPSSDTLLQGEAQAKLFSLVDLPDMLIVYTSAFLDIISLASMEAVDRASKRSIRGKSRLIFCFT